MKDRRVLWFAGLLLLILVVVVVRPGEVLGSKSQGGITATVPPTVTEIVETPSPTMVVTSTKVLPTETVLPFPTITQNSTVEVTIVPGTPMVTVIPGTTPIITGTPPVSVTVVPLPTHSVPTTIGVVRKKGSPFSCAERTFLYELERETGGTEDLWSGIGLNFGEFLGQLVEVTGWGVCLISTDPSQPTCCFIDVVSIEPLLPATPEPPDPCPVEVVAGSKSSLVVDLQNFREHVLMGTVKGRTWIELYNKHRVELSVLLLTHPEVSLNVLEQLIWFYSAWETKKGGLITQARLDQIDWLIGQLSSEMSPELLEDVNKVRVKMWDYKGWTVDEAVRTELPDPEKSSEVK